MSFRIFPLVAAVSVSASPALAETVAKTVPANRPSVVGSFGGYVVSTCLSVGLPDARPREKPVNGDLRIEVQRGKASQGRCQGTEQQFLVFVYTPKKGFKGSDRLSVDIPWQPYEHAPMNALTYTYEITVQ
ncbi:hypothetical protein [Alsobacter sp. R-9]